MPAVQHLIIERPGYGALPYCGRGNPETAVGVGVVNRGGFADYSDVIEGVTCRWCLKRVGVKDPRKPVSWWRRDDEGRLVLPAVYDNGEPAAVGRALAVVRRNESEPEDSPDAWLCIINDAMDFCVGTQLAAQLAAEDALLAHAATIAKVLGRSIR